MYQKLKGNKKGFTLAELLIVVAIIAVLVAIAIPAFSGSLDNAKKAADDANIRSAFADYVAAYLDPDNEEVTVEADKADALAFYQKHEYPDLAYYTGINAATNPWSGTK